MCLIFLNTKWFPESKMFYNQNVFCFSFNCPRPINNHDYSLFYLFNTTHGRVCVCVFQLHDCSMCNAVFVTWCTSRHNHRACAPLRQKHNGLPTVALGCSVFHEHQHCERHKEQPLHICCAGQ